MDWIKLNILQVMNTASSKTKMIIRKKTNLFLQQTIINIVASRSIAIMNSTTAVIKYIQYSEETLARF